MSLKQPQRESTTSRAGTPDRVPACWGRERDRTCLRIETLESGTFILPYQHFVVAHLQREGEDEVLSISFASHEVCVEGRLLEEIVAALQEYAVNWIAPVPMRYAGLREGDSATIAKIEIKTVD